LDGSEVRIVNANLRFLILMPALICLAVPILGIFWLEENIRHLRYIQKSALDLNTQRIAKNIVYQVDLEAEILNPQTYNAPKDLLATPLIAAIVLDGKDADWRETNITHYGKSDLIDVAFPYTDDSLQVDLRIGTWENDLYIFLNVKDEKVIYREVNNLSIHRNDHIKITTLKGLGLNKQYVIAAYQPSTTSTYQVSPTGRALRLESRIKSIWTASNEGYKVEIRLPISLLDTGFTINVADVDNEETRNVKYRMGSGDINEPGSLQLGSDRLKKLLQRYPENNLTVLDTHKRVIAKSGIIDHGSDPLFALWQHKKQTSTFITSLMLKFIDEKPNYNIITSITPLEIEGKQLGYIKSSQTDEGAKLLIQEAFYSITLISFLSILLALALWSLSVKLLRYRIRKITLDIEQVVDSEGRVSSSNSVVNNQDELGDLSRSFSGIVNRLHQYNAYLEAMAGRLAHELRTPISVVKSSLESLSDDQELTENAYLLRAHNGVNRLTNILNKMSEATRLEAALDEDEVDSFNLIEVIEGCYHGYEHAFSDFNFTLKIESNSLIVTGIPELIVQLMDKLVRNATEFSTTNNVIGIRLTNENDEAVIRVINEGPALPSAMQDKLFDSMISVRQNRDANSSHLGLGLYIAKVITHFHGGKIDIKNREDVSGVIVTVSIPLMRLTTKLI
jgi:two-component system sensor histidine kinase ChvG